jgi:hypothetical protein
MLSLLPGQHLFHFFSVGAKHILKLFRRFPPCLLHLGVAADNAFGLAPENASKGGVFQPGAVTTIKNRLLYG